MAKSSMAHAGFPSSLWPEALRNAVYVKNRVYNRGTGGIPYDMMFGVKPDVHHIRTFGALAYVHVPVSPQRKKHQSNVNIGFVLGYAEDVIGCKVYFPDEHTAKFVPDLRVAEDVPDTADDGMSDVDMATVTSGDGATVLHRTTTDLLEDIFEEGVDNDNFVLEEGENDTLVNEDQNEPGDTHSGYNSGNYAEVDSDSTNTKGMYAEDAGHTTTAVEREVLSDDAVSDAGTCGSSAAAAELKEELAQEELDETAVSDDAVTVASTFGAEDDDARPLHLAVLEKDQGEAESVARSNASTGFVKEIIDAGALFPHSQPKQHGKRTHRSETPSKAAQVKKDADKQEPKKTRQGLREYHERNRPRHFDDYVMNTTQRTSRIYIFSIPLLSGVGNSIITSSRDIPQYAL
ncbi:unnamed protein product [Phytophthora fragariaefolia]|uniref:Unnamed protein product n=1 Tax=Phytophthora fragariaefolia TaxID=1490495 RepID=A0A9W6XT88_9STRA|nr:unnamed protein product [Phytophthora fragariaefolia]